MGTQFKSDKSLFNGMPHASADLSDQAVGLGAWKIDVKNDALAGLPPSLRSDGGAGKIYQRHSERLPAGMGAATAHGPPVPSLRGHQVSDSNH